MKQIRSIEVQPHSREEILPGFREDFPHITTCARLDEYAGGQSVWHWHRTAELFYMGSGTLEYTTPGGTWVFPAGSGGFVNPNVLHISRVIPSGEESVQLLHLFDPVLLGGGHGSRMEEKYILPLTGAAGPEIIPLSPDRAEHREILRLLRESFALSEEDWGYEFALRERLGRIWLALLEQLPPAGERRGGTGDETIKALMVYIHEHYSRPISVEELARQGHLSKRACFRLFRERLHMTPVEYIRSVRLRQACRLLERGEGSLAAVAEGCGLGSGSYFGRVFREEFGISPSEYRKRWHDRDKIGRD